jgi:hypothetical protein
MFLCCYIKESNGVADHQDLNENSQEFQINHTEKETGIYKE